MKTAIRTRMLVVSLLATGTLSTATDGVWTNRVNSSWTTTSNWRDGIVASGVGATATFENTASIDQLNQNVDGLTLGNLLLSDGSVMIYNHAITLDNNGRSPTIAITFDVHRRLTLRSNLLDAGDYPIIKTGDGILSMRPDDGFNTFSGGMIVRQGLLEVNSSAQATGTPLGTGSIALQGLARLTVAKAGGTFSAASEPGATFTFAGVNTLSPGSASLTLGAPDAGTDSMLVRENHGLLSIVSDTLGGASKVIVNGGVALVNGLPRLPIMGSLEQGKNPFITYDNTVGFTNAVETIGLGGGATSLALVNQATTLTGNAAVHALRTAVAPNERIDLTIDAGVTLTVGDGVNPARVHLGYNQNSAYGNIVGNGTLDFGTSEGVVTFAAGTGNNNAYWPILSCNIAGSGGLTLMGGDNLGRGTLRLGNSTYTGPTRILKGPVTPLTDATTDAFSPDPIHIMGDETVGGQLLFGYFNGTITNTAYVSGVGSAMRHRNASTKPSGAIAFARTAGTYAGPIILQGNTRLSAPGSTDNVGLISGSISGDYGIEIGYTGTAEVFGTVRFSGENTYTGVTQVSAGTLELLDAASLPPERSVVVTSDLVFNFAENAVFDNAFTGTGRIIQRGGGRIRLVNGENFEGTFIEESGVILLGKSGGTVLVIR